MGEAGGGAELLGRFLPDFLVHRLATTEGAAAAPFAERVHGAVLLADISGFTALAEKLAREGADGAERLTNILDQAFGQLVAIIDEWGGDVIKFAGDALLALWPAGLEGVLDGGLEGAVDAAAGCGLALEAAMRAQASRLSTELSLHVGLGSGELWLFGIGGERERWEYFVAGAPVNAAARACEAASPGEVLLSEEAAARIQDHARGRRHASGCFDLSELVGEGPLEAPRRARPEVSAALMRRYVPGAARARLEAGQGGWLNELRRLTVLFVNLPELGKGVEVEVAQRGMVELQRALYRFEGSVNKLSVDDKGVTLVAAFGLPPLAHEDDARRGVLAALELRERVRSFGWSCSIGVSTGRAFAGVIGGARRCEYTMIGDVVNLSARLMQTADGGILCDAASYRGARAWIGFESLGERRFKGKDASQEVFRPLVESARSAPFAQRGSLVGRGAELASLEEGCAALLDSRSPQRALLIGEAGLGKSRLLAELNKRAEGRGLRCLFGAADSVERTTPYFAWREVFSRLLEDKTSKGPESLERRIEEALGPDLAELAPLCNVVFSAELADNEVTREFSGEVRAVNTSRVLLELLESAAREAPMMLVLEDAHWFDSASWSLLGGLLASTAPIYTVVASRPIEQPTIELRELMGSARVVELAPLGEAASLDLARACLGVDRLPGPVEALLEEKAQGNPFFSEELVYALRDLGLLERVGRRARLTVAEPELRAVAFPDTIEGAVTSRIDRLEASPQLTLKVASVIGRGFSSSLLGLVHPLAEERAVIHSDLDALVRLDLVREEQEGDFVFKHVITQEVAYRQLPEARRRELHGVVAGAYESQFGQHVTTLQGRLAKHWSLAQHWLKAVGYLGRAGEAALRDFANQEAASFLTEAIAHSEDPGLAVSPLQRARWLRMLGEASYRLGYPAKSLECFQASCALLGYPFSGVLWRMTPRLLYEMGVQVLRRLGLRGSRRAGTGESELIAARCYERVCQLEYLNNAEVPFMHAAFKAVNLIESSTASPELARCSSNLTICFGVLSMHGFARQLLRRSTEVAEELGERTTSAYVDFNNGYYQGSVGLWAEGEGRLRRAIAVSSEVGDLRRKDESNGVLAAIKWLRGEFTEGLALAEASTDSARGRDVVEELVWALSLGMLCQLELPGAVAVEESEQEELLQECLARPERLSPSELILGYGALASMRWRRGDRARAEVGAEAADQVVARTQGVALFLLPAYVGLVQIRCAELAEEPSLERRRVLRRSLKPLRGVLKKFGMLYSGCRSRVLLLEGRCRRVLGAPRGARRCWRRALVEAERLELRFDEAWLRLELGRAGGEAKEIVRAGRMFSSLGLDAERRLCDDAAAALARP